MMKKETVLFVLFLTVMSVCSLGAAENDAKIVEFTSPRILGTGASGSVLLPPQTSLINPASAALAQRITFDGSYVGLIGTDGSTSGWNGHVINFGHTIPTKVGVFTWNGSFLTSSFESIDTGSQFGLSGSFAKDIYPDTFVGIGLKTAIADGPQYTAAADLGLIRTRPSAWFLEDVKWSLALQNLGYSDIETVRAPLYTLTAGINGELFGNDKMSGRLIGDVSWVEFTNLRCSAGISLTIGEFFNVALGSRLDMQKVLDGDPGELIPSLSMSYTYIPGDKEGERWTQNELQPYVAAAPLSSELWAASVGLTVPIGRIDKEAPAIEIDLSDLIGEQGADEPEGAPEQGDESQSGNDGQDEDKISQLIRMRTGKHQVFAHHMFVNDENGLPEKPEPDKDAMESGDNVEEETLRNVKTTVDEFTVEELQNVIPEAQIYLSPNNDGVKDALSFPLKISEGRYIKGYEFIVEDENGNRIRTIENKETRPEKRTVRTFFQNLFKAKSGIQVPETIRWDGTTDTGETAPDGLYRFYIRAWDDNENYGTTDTYSIYIDTQPPVVGIDRADERERIFSPNDDGNKDVLPIEQAGTSEDAWKAVFNDASGNPVRTSRWNDSGPVPFEWDGTNDEGLLVPDGVYQYRISSTDRAGNTGSAEYLNLVKNTEETPITLTIDHSHFSPNGDGVLDVVLLQPDVPVVSGVTRWELTVKDSGGRAQRVYRGRTAPAGTTAFDGRDDGGTLLSEGEYTAELDVLYVNGNNPKAVSAPFVIDVTSPRASIQLDNLIFSPNGDGNKDKVNINQETSLEENWYGTITDIDENIVYQYKWIERAESTISWDGREEDGSLADDGYYFYQLSTVDRAGNPGQSRRVRFELNTEETEVLLTTNYDYFSPNGDGTKDRLLILPRLKGSRRVKDYELSVVDGGGREIFSRTGTGDVPEDFTWDGFSGSGERANDGAYTAVLEVTNLNGNRNRAQTQPFMVDTVSPQVSMEAEYDIFSPEGDGRRDTVTFRVAESSREELWEGRVMNADGETVKTAAWQGAARDFVWDGTDSAGNIVPDGTYTYQVYATDRAGNYTEADTGRISLDTSVTKLFVTTDTDKLSPNGDGVYEKITFSTIVTRREGLERWSLELIDAQGTVQKRFGGENEIPTKIEWNGRNEAGNYYESGYKARFTADYRKGNRPSVESLPFILDVSAPGTSIDISPVPFSPDNDGVDDELSIRIGVSDSNEIERWSFTIFDAERSGADPSNAPRFRVFSGTGQPTTEILWDGRSDSGELVYAAMDYPYRFEVRDAFGNVAVESGKIPIDVLVIREGNLLKIKIANINFKPNKAEYVDDDPEITARNEYVLDRLAEILKKYRQYSITIQGHANVTRFWDPALAEEEQREELLPLSEQRARKVMDSLIERNISRDRLSAEGVGGSQPLVPFDDADNRWKNRRVEFILEKE